ncbi:MAG: Cof-type HAD-IIB family hydrolase [Bacillota bacterium]|nr:Cof-type HAD-IIB family hydrolase [Bacillota bacterium]HHT89607.1 HAD family phosphatase [Bacillota bacterium]
MSSRLFVFDIDGTLLTTDYKILPSTKKAIGLLLSRNIQIMLASARPPKAMDPIAAELGLDPFYISLNGALVVQKERILLSQTMLAEAAQRVIALASEVGLSVNLYSNWDWFIQAPNPWSTHEGDMVGFYGEIRDLKTVGEVHKILLMGEQERIIDIQAKLGQELPQVAATRSIPSYLEVVDARVSKGRTLRTVSKLLNVDQRHIVAFGDGENDLTMLKSAGFSVAMGNAHPLLKKEADWITGTNEEDGVLQAVVEILERGELSP